MIVYMAKSITALRKRQSSCSHCPAHWGLHPTIGELRRALDEVRTLSGMIPICGWCKNIRSDKGYWQSVEHYVLAHTEATFTHSICPDCAEKFKAELGVLSAQPT
jgi:hypothetical protein